jgi:tRNA pseudouridine55 synthase
MLPLCFGEATKVCAYLLAADKTYRVTARLGEATDTGDADGKVIETADIPDIDRASWSAICAGFLGQSTQIPPMYSALKQQGKRLYELARQGQVVEREPRPIRIEEIDLLEVHGKRLVFRVRCSKGTYVRTLVEDIAKAAGTVAHTVRLHRESVGDFRSEDMLDMSGAESAAESGPEVLRRHLLPPDRALTGWGDVRISMAAAERFAGGQPVGIGAAGEQQEGDLVRVYDQNDRFRGVGEISADGRNVAPRRIFRLAAEING